MQTSFVPPQVLPDEPWQQTLSYIEDHPGPREIPATPLSFCRIYWRGQFLLLEDHASGMVLYSEHSSAYNFFLQAVLLFDIGFPASWKTADRLVAFRMAIRQTEVNLCGLVESMLVGVPMSRALYDDFMRAARAQDLEHHGSNTF